METIRKNEAQQYAEIILQELQTLETVLTLPYIDSEQSPDVVDFLETYGDIEEAPLNWLNGLLEVEVMRGKNRGRVEILRTFGGPNCWINYSSINGDYVQIEVGSSPDYFSDLYCLPSVAAFLSDLIEVA